MRPLRIAALVLLVIAMSAAPVFAHTVSYTTRETGTEECNFNDDVLTYITAVGHHRHTRVGYEVVIYHTGTDAYYYTPVTWHVFAMNWATSNQAGYSYSFGSSGASCQ